eukprot:1160808-Pelagomonas_calceolata.AAC.20
MEIWDGTWEVSTVCSCPCATGWHLDHVEVWDDATGQRYFFPCQRWLDKTEEDGLIERVLDVSLSTMECALDQSISRFSGEWGKAVPISFFELDQRLSYDEDQRKPWCIVTVAMNAIVIAVRIADIDAGMPAINNVANDAIWTAVSNTNINADVHATMHAVSSAGINAACNADINAGNDVQVADINADADTAMYKITYTVCKEAWKAAKAGASVLRHHICFSWMIGVLAKKCQAFKGRWHLPKNKCYLASFPLGQYSVLSFGPIAVVSRHLRLHG